jgi:geranylgeranyl diphosphate synthase type II
VSGTPFVDFLAGVKAALEDELERALPPESEPPRRLHAALRYSVFAGGKRLRPALVVAAGEAFGAPRERLLSGAAAVELIHTYSLIHDDLPALDDDDLRRGRPTLHRRFDEATAILAGDALLTLGLTRLAAGPAELDGHVRARAVALVGAAIGTGGMIGGQVEDLEAERSWPADAPAALERIHRGKTGALLTASLRLGGLYAGAGEAADRALAAFGETIGLMFQVADDILDVLGDARELGKTPGKDAQAKKLTYPGLHGLEASRQKLAELGREAAERAGALPDRRGIFGALAGFLSARDR